MDRNAITGFVLITILMLVYFRWFAPKPPVRENPSTTSAMVEDSLLRSPSANEISDSLSPEDVALKDSLEELASKSRYKGFFEASKGEEKLLKIQTEELTVVLNTRGGSFESITLNNHLTYDSLPLPIYAADRNNEFSFDINYGNTRNTLNSGELFFQPLQEKNSYNVTGTDSLQLILRASINEDQYIDQIYTFKGNAYDVGYELKMVGLKEDLKSSYYLINWKSELPRTELSVENMRRKSTIVYKQSGEVDRISASDDPEKEELRNGYIDWVSFKSQFFSHIMMANTPFRSVDLRMNTPKVDEINRIMDATITMDAPPSDNIQHKFTFYAGPNKYQILRSYDQGLQKSMDLGWWIVGYINIGTVYIFSFLEKYLTNYGLIIIILAFIFRMAVLPFTYRSNVSMAKMRVINQTPEMKELDEKHKDDPQKLQMAKMNVYKEMGVNMFGGCLPMLFSYPFLIALFFFFPQSVELRQESFLWADDLSTYDNVLDLPFSIPGYGDHVSLFTLLMAISTFIYTLYQQKSQPATAANSQMKYIAYFMPVFLLIFLNNYSSGLSLYYFTSNLITIAQTNIIRFFVNDDKLLAQMRETKKQKKQKGKKGGQPKSRLEKWIEKQQKKQQEMAKQQKSNSGASRRDRRKK